MLLCKAQLSAQKLFNNQQGINNYEGKTDYLAYKNAVWVAVHTGVWEILEERLNDKNKGIQYSSSTSR